MILQVRVENLKDATGELKKVIMATVLTDIPGMEKITAVDELTKYETLNYELSKLATDIIALKSEEVKKSKKKSKK